TLPSCPALPGSPRPFGLRAPSEGVRRANEYRRRVRRANAGRRASDLRSGLHDRGRGRLLRIAADRAARHAAALLYQLRFYPGNIDEEDHPGNIPPATTSFAAIAPSGARGRARSIVP